MKHLSGEIGHNLLTIDVEDYFHANGLRVPADQWAQLPARVEYTTRRLLRLLDEHAVVGTFFVLGWVADRYPSLVREIHDAGHEVASHGWGHRLLYELTPEQFRDDVVRTKEHLEHLTGERVLGYRAPSFSIVPATRWALDILVDTGHLYDSSVYPISRGRYGDPSSPRDIHWIREPSDIGRGLLEVPPMTLRVFERNLPVAGGGYFRAFPYWFTRWAVGHLNRVEEQPAVVYVHPWELDPDQPRLPASRGNRFRHYLNLDRTEARLRALLTDYPMGCVRDALGLPTVTLPVAEPTRKPERRRFRSA